MAVPGTPASGDTPATPATPMTVEFQTGYPYIGLSEASWNILVELVGTTWNPNIQNNFRKSNNEHNQYVYWVNTDCADVNMPGDFVITLGGQNYTIAMENLLSDTQWNSRHDCDLFFVQLDEPNLNSIRLGDPFFSAFLPVFDIEQDQIGLALNARAYENVSVTDWTPSPTPASAMEKKDLSKETIDSYIDDVYVVQN